MNHLKNLSTSTWTIAKGGAITGLAYSIVGQELFLLEVHKYFPGRITPDNYIDVFIWWPLFFVFTGVVLALLLGSLIKLLPSTVSENPKRFHLLLIAGLTVSFTLITLSFYTPRSELYYQYCGTFNGSVCDG